jgi:hypothetical protein
MRLIDSLRDFPEIERSCLQCLQARLCRESQFNKRLGLVVNFELEHRPKCSP